MTVDATAYYQRRRHQRRNPEPTAPRPADFPILPARVVHAVAHGQRITPPDGRLDQALLMELADGVKLANNDQVNALARECAYWRSINEGAA